MQDTYYSAERRAWAALRLSDWHRKLPHWMWCTDIDSIGLGMQEQTFVEISSETNRAVAVIEYKHENWVFRWNVALMALAELAYNAKVPFYVVRYHPSDNTFDIYEVQPVAHGYDVTKTRLGFSALTYCRFLASLHSRTLPVDFVVPEFDQYTSITERVVALLDKYEDDLTSHDINRGIWAFDQLRNNELGGDRMGVTA